jgi:hypothetical protein
MIRAGIRCLVPFAWIERNLNLLCFADGTFADFNTFSTVGVAGGGHIVMRNCTFVHNFLLVNESFQASIYVGSNILALGRLCPGGAEEFQTGATTLVRLEGCYFPTPNSLLPILRQTRVNSTVGLFSDTSDIEVYSAEYPFLCEDAATMSDLTASPPQRLDGWPQGVRPASLREDWILHSLQVLDNSVCQHVHAILY